MNLRDYLAAANLPGFESDFLEDSPTIARVHVRSDSADWDWFFAEYSPESGLGYGLVRGRELEYGNIDAYEVEAACPDLRVVESFVPTPITEVYTLYSVNS